MKVTDHISQFLKPHFPKSFKSKRRLKSNERAVIANVIQFVESRFSKAKYVLGLAIDFTILAQRLALEDDDANEFQDSLTTSRIFKRYELTTQRGGRKSNTLTLSFGETQEGIRRIEEQVCEFFHSLNRSGYPSAYVYNTGQWKKFEELLVMCFKLSASGRYALCEQLLQLGLEKLEVNSFFGRATPRVRLFEQIVSDYPRAAKGENGGMAFQGIANGFFKADRPHLSIVADKVRTGSARQKRIGDIDGYLGLDLELSVEVKDLQIDKNNIAKEFGAFQNQVAAHGILGIAFVDVAEAEIRDELAKSGVAMITSANVTETITGWDWPKQNSAVNGMLHFLSHVEQSPAATKRLLAFISERDPKHDSLTYLNVE